MNFPERQRVAVRPVPAAVKRMIGSIKQYAELLVKDVDSIPAERKQLLKRISGYILQKKEHGKPINLVYICTHNSRRSHFGQVWAQVAAHYYHIPSVHTFSGGTEATAFNANAINALKRIGFIVRIAEGGTNPVYHLVYDEQETPTICFSKVFDDATNPPHDFAAIMTCSDAEENCPFIPGAEIKVATTYEDPKLFDNTPLQDEKYDERCRQIALETFFVFSQVS